MLLCSHLLFSYETKVSGRLYTLRAFSKCICTSPCSHQTGDTQVLILYLFLGCHKPCRPCGPEANHQLSWATQALETYFLTSLLHSHCVQETHFSHTNCRSEQYLGMSLSWLTFFFISHLCIEKGKGGDWLAEENVDCASTMVMPFKCPEHHTHFFLFLGALPFFLIAASSERLQVILPPCSNTVFVFWKVVWRATLQNQLWEWLPEITLANHKQRCHLLQYQAIHPLERLSHCIHQSCQWSQCCLSRQIFCKSSTLFCCLVRLLYASFPLELDNLQINTDTLILRVRVKKTDKTKNKKYFFLFSWWHQRTFVSFQLWAFAIISYIFIAFNEFSIVCL